MAGKRDAERRCNPAQASPHYTLFLGERVTQASGERRGNHRRIDQRQRDPALNDRIFGLHRPGPGWSSQAIRKRATRMLRREPSLR